MGEAAEVITIQEIQERALTVPEKARNVKIMDDKTYEAAGEILLQIKDLRKQIDAAFDPIIKKAHEAHKEAVSQKKRADAPLVEAENILKPQIGAYLAEKERQRREEEERLREEARKQEEEERLRAAIAAEQAGQKEVAEEIMETPFVVAPVVVPKTTPKVAGISTRQNWKFRIVSEKLIPREYLAPDMVKIGGVVRALKDKANIPGVEVFPEDTIAAGRR